MKKSPFSKSNSEVNEVKLATSGLGRTENYRRKARKLVMRLREQKRRVQRAGECEAKQVSPPAVNLEPLFYQARFGVLSSTRKEALEGLVMIDRFAELTWKALGEALDDTEPEVRAKAAELLATYPPPLPETILEKLIQRAWDSELMVRRVVARVLSYHPDPRSIGPLMGLLGTSDDELRETVEDSINTICTRLGPPPPRTDADT